MKKIYEKLILPTINIAPEDTVTGLQRVCDTSRYAFVVDSMRAISVSKNLTCEVVMPPQAFIPATGTFIIGKHSPYRRLINSK
jgi:hypothetical protein